MQRKSLNLKKKIEKLKDSHEEELKTLMASQEEKLEKPKGVGSSRGGITKREAGKGTISSSIRINFIF